MKEDESASQRSGVEVELEKHSSDLIDSGLSEPSRSELRQNVGFQEYIEAQNAGVNPSETKSSHRIRLKIDCFVLSFMFTTGVLQFLDKTALNYANLFGIRKALNLSGSQFSWLASIFYLGVLGVCTFFWGVTVLAFPWAINFAGAATCRFFLGVFEAPITPGITIAVGHWWTRNEAALRYNFIYSSLGWAGIIGSLMSTGISKDSDGGNVQRWQLVFVILGSITTIWGILLFALLPDSPIDARFFDHHKKLIATTRVAQNQVGIKSERFKLYQVKSAVMDFKTWCIVISVFAAGVPNGVISNFSTELISNLGFSTIKTTLMDCVGNAFQVTGLLIGGYIAATAADSRILVASAGNVACLIAAACLAYLPDDRTWMKLVAFWFTNLQSVSFALGVNMISVNMAGYSKKQTANALAFMAYCVGNIVGPQFVIQSQAPDFGTATKAMIAGFAVKLVCHAALGLYMLSVNRSRDRQLQNKGDVDEEVKREAERNGMLDQTEFENRAFRYVL